MNVTFMVEERERGKRLDAYLHGVCPEFSRSRIQEWIRAGRVTADGRIEKASFVVRGGERVEMEPAALRPLRAEAEPIPLNILYEDEWIVAVNKPAGMVVHAGAGIASGTLVNALLHRFSKLSSAGGELRPGIVHRLDRFTSGVLLVAKSDAAHQGLSKMFAARQIRKTYLALVHGSMVRSNGRIEKPIARDPVNRTKMTSRLGSGRAAWTEWTVLKQFPGFSYLEIRIGTGRTHQIRVHLSSMGHPVAEDRLYGAPARVPGMQALGRYFLHAHRLEFRHPLSGEELRIEAPLATELEEFLARLPER